MERIESYLDRLCLELKAPPAETAELRAELKAHLDEKVQGYLSQGLSEDESIEKTLADFGNARAVGGELIRGTRRDFRRLVLRRLLQVASVALFFFCLLAFLYWMQQLYRDFPDRWTLALISLLLVVGALALEMPRLVFQDEHQRPLRFDWLTLLIYGLPALLLAMLWAGYVSISPWLREYSNYCPQGIVWILNRFSLVYFMGSFLLGLALMMALRERRNVPCRRLLQITGVSVFMVGLYYYVYLAWRRALGFMWPLDDYERALWTVVFSGLLILGTLALSLPRWVDLALKKDRVVGLDATTLLIYVTPGLILILLPFISHYCQGDAIQWVIGWLSVNCRIEYAYIMGGPLIGVGISHAVRCWEKPSGTMKPETRHQSSQPVVPAG